MKKKPTIRFYAWAHNIDGCLRNGSFVCERADGTLIQWMNGDNMGIIDVVPKTMTEVAEKLAKELLPRCCGGKGGA